MEKSRAILEYVTKRVLYILKKDNIKLDCYSYGHGNGATEHCDIAIDCIDLTEENKNKITAEKLNIKGTIIFIENPYKDIESLKDITRIAITLN